MAATEAAGLTLSTLSEPTPVACLEEARRGFDIAATNGVIERSYAIGGRAVTTRFAGPALVGPIGDPLEHHGPASSASPRLTINLWDVASTGVPMPSFPEHARDGGVSAAGRLAPPGPIRLAYLPSQRALCVLEVATGEAFYCTADATRLPYWELGAPLLTLLQWWLGANGRQVVHGAALGTERGGVLLVAPGGSGKSSTALAALSPRTESCGLRYAGDDYCLVGTDDEPRAHTLYGTGKVTPDQAARFPDLVAGPLLNGDRPGDDKAVFLVSRQWPERMIHSFPIVAMVVPVIDGGVCRTEPLPAGQALRALAPSTVLQLQGAGEKTLAILASLTRRLPTYALRLAPDPHAAPPVIAALVEQLTGAASMEGPSSGRGPVGA